MPKKFLTKAEEKKLLQESERFDKLSIEELAKMWNKATPVDVKFMDKRPKRKAAAKTTKKPTRSVRSTTRS